MKTPITALASVTNRLVAASISRPDKTQISIQPLEHSDSLDSVLKSNIEFVNGESVATYRWIRLENPSYSKKNNPSSSKKRKNSVSSDNGTSTSSQDVDDSSVRYIDYLVVLLTTGEILLYSTFTQEFVNKISIDSPFSAIDVINKIGHPKKALYNYDYDIVAFDPEASALKLFCSTSPQLIDSIPFKNDPLISYILFNSSILDGSDSSAVELFLASSSTLYLLDKHHEIIDTIDISLPSSSTSPVKAKSSKPPADGSTPPSILKIVKEDSKLYIIRTGCSLIQAVDLGKGKANKSAEPSLFTASANITDVSLLKTSKSNILAATLVDGSIELFSRDDASGFAKLEIKGGNDVGKFVGLLNSTDVIDEVYKGIWYDNFNLQITDFEFENIHKLKNTIQIGVTELPDFENELLDMADEQDEEDIASKETVHRADDNADEEDDSVDIDYECSDLNELCELLKPRLTIEQKSDVEDKSLKKILSQNVAYAKSLIYILSVSESNVLFAKVSYILSQCSASTEQGFVDISNVKSWLKWLIILRGSVLTQNDDSVGWLKLLQSEFNQESRILNNMIKLTGKLGLLRDQSNIRNEIMKRKNGEEQYIDSEQNEDGDDIDENYEEAVSVNETALGDDLTATSVVLDGEGGFDEEEDQDDQETHDGVDNDDDNDDLE